MISEPDTLITCAAIPPIPTANGSSKPTPSIVTRVPPVDGPAPGPNVVMTIFGMSRNPTDNVASLPDATLTTRTFTGPVTTPEPPGAVSLARGLITMSWLKFTLITCASAAPKNTWIGTWNASPKIVTRVPPLIGPEVGCTARSDGVRTASWKVNAVGIETVCSP